jgi:hypothetical protein
MWPLSLMGGSVAGKSFFHALFHPLACCLSRSLTSLPAYQLPWFRRRPRRSGGSNGRSHRSHSRRGHYPYRCSGEHYGHGGTRRRAAATPGSVEGATTQGVPRDIVQIHKGGSRRQSWVHHRRLSAPLESKCFCSRILLLQFQGRVYVSLYFRVHI